jgi:uncharacterized membrane protein
MTSTATRRTYLDLLRGVAVLVMIEAHVIDSWTRVLDRRSLVFYKSLILGGFGAPLFLFLAGVAVAMSAGSKARRLGDEGIAARMVQKRGLEIFLLAFLFRLQSFLVSRSPAWAMLKVDILNVMGPSIILTALLWRVGGTLRRRLVVLGSTTVAIVFLSASIRALPWLAPLPDFLEGYVRPIPGLTNFTFFPWAAFVTAGGVVGVLLDAARSPGADRRLNLWLGLSGAVMGLAAYRASFLPALDVRSSFWTTSPSFFFIRIGVMTAAIALAYWWEQRPTAGRRWSPLQTLGRSSLFVYWIHVELVYGLISTPLHGSLTLGQAWLGLGVFCVFMVVCAIAKDRIKSWWQTNGRARFEAPVPSEPPPSAA